MPLHPSTLCLTLLQRQRRIHFDFDVMNVTLVDTLANTLARQRTGIFAKDWAM